MTTATETHQPSRGCYQRGCQTPECRQANYRYMSRLHLDHHRGQKRRHDATQIRHHIERLIAAHWTQAQIARAAHLAHHLIGDIRRGQPTVAVATAYAILSIPLGQPPADLRDVDATGTMRRLRALVAIGWPIEQLAPRLGIWPTALGNIARGELAHVRIATAETITHRYQQLIRQPGPSNRARLLAAKKGWHGPLAWDGPAIDDPTAQPDVEQAIELELKREDLAAHRRAEIEHLASFNLSTHEIAARLDMAPGYVRDIARDIAAANRRHRPAEGAATDPYSEAAA